MMQGVLSGDIDKMMKQMGLNQITCQKNMPGGMPGYVCTRRHDGISVPDLSALGRALECLMSQCLMVVSKESRRIHDETGDEQDGQTNAQE